MALAASKGLSQLRKPAVSEPPVGDLLNAVSEPTDNSVTINAVIEAELYKSPDGNYRVYLVKHGKETFTVNTRIPTEIHVGETAEINGKYSTYKGKKSFDAKHILRVLPKSADGLKAWAKTGVVPGFGMKSAEKIAKMYKDDDIAVVMEDVGKLVAAGISMKIATSIAEMWSSQSSHAELVVYLGSLGLGPAITSRIMKKYGMSAKNVIARNPWELTDTIEGVGFQKADALAMRAEHPFNSPDRIKAGLRYALREAVMKDGHCGLPKPLLIAKAAQLCQIDKNVIASYVDEALDGVNAMYDEETQLACPMFIRNAEISIVDHIKRLQTSPICKEDVAEKAVRNAEVALGISLDDSQRKAAICSISNPVSIITGGPGTGKSTTQKVILKVLSTQGRDVVLAAPTGRAAKRLAEVSGVAASTCHRLLQFKGDLGFTYHKSNPFKEDWFIADEFSMVDTRLADSFIQAIRTGAGLTIVGDVDQLPSVGSGQVLRDMIESGVIPTSKLSVVHRQSNDSGIIVAAHAINSGNPPLPEGQTKIKGFAMIEMTDPEVITERIVDLVTRWAPERGFDPLKDVQVLAPKRQGDVGIEALNIAIKAGLNPAKDDSNTITIKGRKISVGDRMMHIRNDYEKGVYNGEVGIVSSVYKREGKSLFDVDYSGEIASYSDKDLEDVEPAYAVTVHKSQGCEFPVVIMVAHPSQKFMLNRNLIYTGITRAKTLCIIISDPETLASSAQKLGGERFTGLKHIFQTKLSPYSKQEFDDSSVYGNIPKV